MIVTAILAQSCSSHSMRYPATSPYDGEFCARGENVVKHPLTCSLTRGEYGAYYRGGMFILKTRVLSSQRRAILEIAVSHENGLFVKSFYTLPSERSLAKGKKSWSLGVLPPENSRQNFHTIDGESYSNQNIVLSLANNQLGVASFSLAAGKKTLVVENVKKLAY